MPNIFNLFNRSIKWNTFEAIVYQTVLTIHQILLFSLVSRLEYAQIGIIFSLLFLSLVFLNLGFDKSIVSFFSFYSKSKSNLRRYFFGQLCIQLIVLTCVAVLINIFSSNIDQLFCAKFKCSSINYLNWLILSFLLISEGLKKSLRNFAQLAFLNKQTAIIEVFAIVFYFIAVWSQYLINNTLNLIVLLAPFLIESIISNLLLIFVVFKYYKSLDNTQITKVSVKEIISNRFYVYINQISHLFFSGNFIIPYLAYMFTLEQVSLLKLTNNITIFITVCMDRIFGITSGALFSHVKNLKVIQTALNISTQKLYNILYAIIIFLIINFKFITSFNFTLLDINWLTVYLFLFLIFFENFFITYEQFLISEKKTYYLMIINSICAFLFFIFLDKSSFMIQEILTLLIIIRMFALILLRAVCWIKLKVVLPYTIRFKYLMSYVFISLIFFLVSKFFM